MKQTIQKIDESPHGPQGMSMLSELREKLQAEDKVLTASMTELSGSRAEIAILGGLAIGNLASRLNTTIFNYATSGEYASISEELSALSIVMHADIDIDNPARERILAEFSRKSTSA
ncbi:hypothetical protein ACTWLT_02380 [Micromonospora sp. ZYX-F-536]|uniref:hypothetical protein n=1 Tax=Micromonospora sp. ZYX-F-536 TaxID=3457629 RepID=UPI004040A4A4